MTLINDSDAYIDNILALEEQQNRHGRIRGHTIIASPTKRDSMIKKRCCNLILVRRHEFHIFDVAHLLSCKGINRRTNRHRIVANSFKRLLYPKAPCYTQV